MRLYISQMYLRLSKYNEHSRNQNSAIQLLNAIRYPLHHIQIQVYSITDAVAHLGTDQSRRRLCSVIIQEAVFLRDMAVNYLTLDFKWPKSLLAYYCNTCFLYCIYKHTRQQICFIFVKLVLERKVYICFLMFTVTHRFIVLCCKHSSKLGTLHFQMFSARVLQCCNLSFHNYHNIIYLAQAL